MSVTLTSFESLPVRDAGSTPEHADRDTDIDGITLTSARRLRWSDQVEAAPLFLSHEFLANLCRAKVVQWQGPLLAAHDGHWFGVRDGVRVLAVEGGIDRHQLLRQVFPMPELLRRGAVFCGRSMRLGSIDHEVEHGLLLLDVSGSPALGCLAGIGGPV
jgi:hypothetical protein